MKKIATLLVFVVVSSCSTQTFLLSKKGGFISDHTTLQSFFIFGINQQRSINVADVCGGADKVARVLTKIGPFESVLAIMTLGIYVPRTLQIYCISKV